MCLKAVCRLCLVMNVPMHNVNDSPLQSVYEKLTNVSLQAAPRPVAACYLCYSQLKKCHKLMVRSIEADKALTQILRSGEVVDLESITIKSREIGGLNELIVRPVQLIDIAGSGYSPIDAKIKEEPLSPQCKEEIDMDRQRFRDYFTFEENLHRVVHQDVESFENSNSMNREVSEQLDNGAAIKQEKPEEANYMQRGIGFLKTENSDGEDNENIELTGEENIKREQPLLFQRKEVLDIDVERRVDYLKLEGSQYVQDIGRVITADVENIAKEEFTDGREVENVELREAVAAYSIKPDSVVTTSCFICRNTGHIADSCPKRYKKKYGKQASSQQVNLCSETAGATLQASGAAPATKRKQRRKIQDGSTLSPGGKNILEKAKIHKAVVEEATSNIDSNVLRGTKTANNRQASTNSYSDTAVFNSDASIVSDVSTGTNRDVNDTSKHLKGKFVSDDCGNVFDGNHLLIDRSISVIKRPKSAQHFECDICKRRFNKRYALEAHLGTHTEDKRYKCEICKVGFNYESNLRYHLRAHTGERPFKCEICKVGFKLKNTLRNHLKIHTGENLYNCEICKAGFTVKNTLRLHLRTHTGLKPYECEICKVRFNTYISLQEHLTTHTGEKPYECDICKVKLTKYDTLKAHLRIHTGEKPYECEICKIRFSQKRYLKNHLRIHTGEKPFECQICKARFRQNGTLQSHAKIHTKKRPECEICKVTFNHKNSLKSHLKLHTPMYMSR